MFKLALLVSKITSIIGNIFGRGSSLPGYLALKLDKNILGKIKLPENTIVVTGTNGKTSTTSYIASVLKTQGIVVSNDSGANMLQGVLSVILKHTDMKGVLKSDYLVLEVDEAYMKHVSKEIDPKYIVVTNIFKDQVSRFSTLDMVKDLINTGISKDSTLILNADDPYVKSLSDDLDNDVIYFSIKPQVMSSEAFVELCPQCKEELVYESQIYNHLGLYECECGFEYPQHIKYQISDWDANDKEILIHNYKYETGQDPLYTLYNKLAAISVLNELNVENSIINQVLKNHQVGMGRMELLTVRGHETMLNLVKNPAGINQVLNYIKMREVSEYSLLLAIHSREPDSDDIEWLKEINVESLNNQKVKNIIISGDESLRVKDLLIEIGVESNKLIEVHDLNTAVDKSLQCDKSPVYFLANYSALVPLRNIIINK